MSSSATFVTIEKLLGIVRHESLLSGIGQINPARKCSLPPTMIFESHRLKGIFNYEKPLDKAGEVIYYDLEFQVKQ